MMNLAKKLKIVPGIHHTLYADDITVWVTRGSLGEREERLHEAATCVEEYVRERGLACSTKKLEVLRVGSRKQTNVHKQREPPSQGPPGGS